MLKTYIAWLFESARRLWAELSWAESGKDLAEPFHVFQEALLFSPELGFWI